MCNSALTVFIYSKQFKEENRNLPEESAAVARMAAYGDKRNVLFNAYVAYSVAVIIGVTGSGFVFDRYVTANQTFAKDNFIFRA